MFHTGNCKCTNKPALLSQDVDMKTKHKDDPGITSERVLNTSCFNLGSVNEIQVQEIGWRGVY